MPGWGPRNTLKVLEKKKLLSSTMGNLSAGLFTRDFEKWMKGALEV